ncbi:unnamed protein product [Kluyveromyces dobzhanskii CBS 2104]|uniref:WGS project CCBQ000000000 data, contig MAT n=1 Tax=Kluyveromyces dobzhanskii CBS 2104 TaxID=1427455 RepID=A0A0A8L3W9_9SACH|nr:unnamed protein product [Kluyveromyces dobzhanskii CBS 2104]
MHQEYTPLSELLTASNDKRTSLIDWITVSISSKSLNAGHVIDDTVKFIRDLVVTNHGEALQYESKTIIYQLANLSVLCLKQLYQEKPGKVYDFASILAIGSNYLFLFHNFVASLTSSKDSIEIEENDRFNVFHNQVLPFLTESARTSIITKIFGSTEKFFPIDKPNQVHITLGLLSVLFKELPGFVLSDKALIKKIQSTLLEVSSSESQILRITSVHCLQIFFYNVPYQITNVVDELLERLSTQFQSGSHLNCAANHGTALMIASIITCPDPDFVNYDLVMRVTVFAIGTLKNNTISTKHGVFEKELLCWILLTGALCLRDTEYIKIHSSQLFVFWRNIFTHSVVYHNEEELAHNIEIRNHSLSCLISFLRSCVLTEELAKQVFYLMTKCLNFKHSISVDSDIMKELLVRYEHRIYQVFLLICPLVHKDVTTSALLQALKNFSNPSNRAASSCFNTGDFYKMKDLIEVPTDDRFCDVLIRNDSVYHGVSTFVKPVSLFSSPKSCLLEEVLLKPVTVSRTFDFNHIILDLPPPPPLSVSLVDVSLELFSLCFPFTNPSVQRSLLETLNSNLLTNSHIPHKFAVVKANILFALFLTLEEVKRSKLRLSSSLGELIITILDECCFVDDDNLFELKGKCFSNVCAAVQRSGDDNFTKTLINVSIQRIVEDPEPVSRGLNLFVISSVLNEESSNNEFLLVLDVIQKFIQDPHPIINVSGLKCLHVLLEKRHLFDISTGVELLQIMCRNMFSNEFGPFSPGSFGNIYSHKFNPHAIMCVIVSVMIQMFGPDILLQRISTKKIVTDVVYALQLSAFSEVQTASLKILQTLSLFKLDEFFSLKLSLNVVKSKLTSMLKQNISVQYLVLCADSDGGSWCTTDAFNVCLQFLCELGKLQKSEIYLDKQLNQLLWGCFFVFPKSRLLRSYLYGWFESEALVSSRAFRIVIKMFNISFGKYLGVLFKNEKLGIAVQSDVTLLEEEKGINEGVPEDNTVSENIGSYARQFLLELLSFGVNSVSCESRVTELCSEIPEMIKLCYTCCSSDVPWLQISALKYMKCMLRSFGEIVDPDDPSAFVMEQFSPIFCGAVLPIFSRASYPKVVCEAIDVCAEIVSYGLVPFSVNNRVVKMLVESLLEIASSKSEIKIGASTFQLTTRQQEVKHSILRGWGTLQCKSFQSKNEELEEFVKEYLNVLVPLWIITIRELHSPVWLKIVDSLCAVQSQDPSIINNFDLEGFVFVMFGEILP